MDNNCGFFTKCGGRETEGGESSGAESLDENSKNGGGGPGGGGQEDSARARVTVSFLEIYNEQLRDLLNPTVRKKPLYVHQHPKLGVYVPHLTEAPVAGHAEAMSRLDYGSKIRVGVSVLWISRIILLWCILAAPVGNANSFVAQEHQQTHRQIFVRNRR